jgi:hypothetical protein
VQKHVRTNRGFLRLVMAKIYIAQLIYQEVSRTSKIGMPGMRGIFELINDDLDNESRPQ